MAFADGKRTTPGPKPAWLKVPLPHGETTAELSRILRERGLHTVCESAKCPNLAECWAGGTATFMLLGDVCTRGCRFCNVKTHKDGLPIDEHEPQKVADAVMKAIAGSQQVLVTPGPIRPLLAVAQLFPGLERRIIKRMGIVEAMRDNPPPAGPPASEREPADTTTRS